MAFNAAGVVDLFERVRSHAQTTGLFETVNTHEPKNPPGPGLWCAIWLRRIGPVARASGLTAVTGRVELTVRVGSNSFQEPQDGIDPEITNAVATLMAAYGGAFTLDATVMTIDLLGAYGVALSAEAGYVTIGSTFFRFMDITMPVIIDNLYTESA